MAEHDDKDSTGESEKAKYTMQVGNGDSGLPEGLSRVLDILGTAIEPAPIEQPDGAGFKLDLSHIGPTSKAAVETGPVSNREPQNRADYSAKYNIAVGEGSSRLPEGMMRVLDILSDNIDPSSAAPEPKDKS